MKKILLFVAILASVLLLSSGAVKADASNFVVVDFDGLYNIENTTHGGKMGVTETIKVNFSDQNHGILRAIPVDYRGNTLRLEIQSVKLDGTESPYSTYKQANNKVLKIGDTNKTITGDHTYEIRYTMSNIITSFDRYDEWYWDVNGDQWQQPFYQVRGEVILPEGWSSEGIPSSSCYTGKLKSTQSVCDITKTDKGYKFMSTSPLGPNETLTVAIPFQKGVFVPRDKTDWYKDNAKQLVGLGVGLALSAFAISQWWRWGRDYKGKGIVVPEYEVPLGLTPAEAGMLYDYHVDSRDLTATLIDLAVRGYIKVHDEQSKILGLFKQRKFKLELMKTDFKDLKHHETALLSAIFAKVQQGEIQDISKINKSSMLTTVSSIRTKMRDSLVKDYGLIEEAPKKQVAILVGLLVLSFAVVLPPVAGLGWGWILGLVIQGAVAILCMAGLSRRSHAGVESLGRIKGLKMYMETAEKDRLAMTQSVDRPFAEPSHTVELFEKLLPYAVALGVEKSWSKQFENIYREEPSWYTGNYGTFNAVYFANTLGSSVSALNSNFTTSTSSSGSGSGGGGFAGGGGGGGGGGGW